MDSQAPLAPPNRPAGGGSGPAYAELWCLTSFSFLRGASMPDELMARAKQLGYSALAITDECSLSGVVRAHVAAKEVGQPMVVGSQFQVDVDGPAPFTLIVLACNLNGYGNLSEFITGLRRASPEKGTYQLTRDGIDPAALADCVVLAAPKRGSSDQQIESVARWMLGAFTGRCWLAVSLMRVLGDEMWLYKLRQVSELTAIPLVAAGDVHMHVRSRKPLQDVLTSTKVGRPLTECGMALQPNAERHLRTRLRLIQTYPADLLEETLRVVARCDFSLDELRYEYPDEVVPTGETPDSYLRRVTYEGAGRRWPQGLPAKVQHLIEHELELIAELQFARYFLTVFDLVAFARSRQILCQGRGSAANSVVCFCLGVTEVDPSRMSMLFERFLSKDRAEPPDIDIDFEASQREVVLQYLYEKYGRDRAGMTGVFTCYRPKSAIRDVAKSLGFSGEVIDKLTSGRGWSEGTAIDPEHLAAAGLSQDDLAVQQLLQLTTTLHGFPRQLSQHTGGFILTRGKLSRMVPIENAAMDNRTVIEWDKYDLDAQCSLHTCVE